MPWYSNNRVGFDRRSFRFRGLGVDIPVRLIALGMIVSVAGQFGDLMDSSIKRDIGIKDMGVFIPGHGGFLDRFDSMLLVAPAVFSTLDFFVGSGLISQSAFLAAGMDEWQFEPASVFGSSGEQRRLSLRREVGLERAISRSLWRSITRVYLATAHRLKIRGRENLPTRPPFAPGGEPRQSSRCHHSRRNLALYDLSARFSRSRPATHFLRNGLRQFSRPRS